MTMFICSRCNQPCDLEAASADSKEICQRCHASSPGMGEVNERQINFAMTIGSLGLLILAISPLFLWIAFGAGGRTGITGDGKIVLVVSLLAGLFLGIATYRKQQLDMARLIAGGWGVVAVIWMGGLIWRIGDLLDPKGPVNNPFAVLIASQMSPGTGLYLGLLGGAMVAGSLGFISFNSLKQQNKSYSLYLVYGVAMAVGCAIIFTAEHIS